MWHAHKTTIKAEAAAGRESTQTHFADEAPSFRTHEATAAVAGVPSADTSTRSTAELGVQSITGVDVENVSA